jgi:hypothetical protein
MVNEIEIVKRVLSKLSEEATQATEKPFLLFLCAYCRAELWPSENACDEGKREKVLASWQLSHKDYEQLIEQELADRVE